MEWVWKRERTLSLPCSKQSGHEPGSTTPEEARAWRKAPLAGFKVPGEVVFARGADMLRTANCKVLHRVVRRRFAQTAA